MCACTRVDLRPNPWFEVWCGGPPVAPWRRLSSRQLSSIYMCVYVYLYLYIYRYIGYTLTPFVFLLLGAVRRAAGGALAAAEQQAAMLEAASLLGVVVADLEEEELDSSGSGSGSYSSDETDESEGEGSAHDQDAGARPPVVNTSIHIYMSIGNKSIGSILYLCIHSCICKPKRYCRLLI